MRTVSCKHEQNWLRLALKALEYQGFALIEDVVDSRFLDETRGALLEVRRRIEDDVGPATLAQAARQGYPDLPLILRYHEHFLKFLELPPVLSLVDHTIGPTAILRFMNGFIIEASDGNKDRPLFAHNRFHMNYKQVMKGYRASIDFAIYMDTGADGAHFGVVPGSHQRMTKPSEEYLEWAEQELALESGTMLVMDSTLWHREKPNLSDHHWLAVAAQFTQPFIKQHTDLVRAIGEERVSKLPVRIRRLIGWEARVPGSLKEFYRPPEERLYKAPWMIGMKESQEGDQVS